GMLLSQFLNQFLIQWFDKAHVCYAGIEQFSCRQSRLQHTAESQYGNGVAFSAQHALAYGQGLHRFLYFGARPLAARIAYSSRAWILIARVQHLSAFIFI